MDFYGMQRTGADLGEGPLSWQLIWIVNWITVIGNIASRGRLARSDVEHSSHVSLTMHRQDQDGVRSVVEWRFDAFCGGFRRDTMIEIIETKDDDEIDQYTCFSAAVNEVIIILYT